MYKLLVSYLGAVTLLAFTEGAPVTWNTTLLEAIQYDIGMLNKSARSVISGVGFNTPKDIKDTCLTNALACFVIELSSVRRVIEVDGEGNAVALNNIDKIRENANAYLKEANKSSHSSSPLRDMCLPCEQTTKQGGDFLNEFSHLLKRMVSRQ